MIFMAREITKDVEAERKKRFAAVKIPEKTVKEYTPAGLMVEKKKVRSNCILFRFKSNSYYCF